MFTMAKVREGSTYLDTHLTHSDYYSEKERVTGKWVGEGARLLGLAGKSIGPGDKAFEHLRQNRLPDGSGKLTLRDGHNRVASPYLCHPLRPAHRIPFQFLQPPQFFRRQLCALPPYHLGGGGFRQFGVARLGGNDVRLCRGRCPPMLSRERGNPAFHVRPALGEALADARVDALDLESANRSLLVPDFLELVSQAPDFAGQLVLIDLPRIPNRPEHFLFGQRPPLPAGRVVSPVNGDIVLMQLRIERPAGGVTEPGGADVAGNPVMLFQAGIGPSGGEPFQFGKSPVRRPAVALDEPLVTQGNGHDGDAFLCRHLKVEEANLSRVARARVAVPSAQNPGPALRVAGLAGLGFCAVGTPIPGAGA